MWICTGFGMFMPVLRPKELFDKNFPDDPRTIQIRARREKELDMLRELYMPDLGANVATPDRDYNFRAYCTPEVAADGFAKAIREINYEHFKETSETVYHDKPLHDVYMRIWSAATALNPPYGGWKSKSYSYPSVEPYWRNGTKSAKASARTFEQAETEKVKPVNHWDYEIGINEDSAFDIFCNLDDGLLTVEAAYTELAKRPEHEWLRYVASGEREEILSYAPKSKKKSRKRKAA